MWWTEWTRQIDDVLRVMGHTINIEDLSAQGETRILVSYEESKAKFETYERRVWLLGGLRNTIFSTFAKELYVEGLDLRREFRPPMGMPKGTPQLVLLYFKSGKKV